MTQRAVSEPLSRSRGVKPVIGEPDRELSLREIVAVLREYWRRLLLLGLAGAAIAAVLVLLTPRTYTSTASFLPESRRGGGGLSSVAQQYGISLPGMGGDGSQSLQFYMELVRSREILNEIVVDTVRYTGPQGTVTMPVTEYLELEGQTQAERLEEGVEKLRFMIRPGANLNTGIVRVSVTTQSAPMSQALALRTLALVNEFNLERRQSQGAEERRFAERRMSEMSDSLRAAEWRLQEFEQRNAQYLLSPSLRTEHRRLLNNVGAKQTLHTVLAQAYEQARMEEVRDTPVITTLENPSMPVRPDSRGGVPKVLFGFIVALGLGLVVVFVRENARVWTPAR